MTAASHSMGAEPTPVSIGSSFQLDSGEPGISRSISVHLPGFYESTAARYPVVYMLNGQSTAMFAGTAAALDATANESAPEMILVGIENQNDDFFFVRPNGQPGGAEQFMQFLEKSVIPEIEKRYRTAPYRILYGQSNAGFFAVSTFLKKTGLFQAYLCSSPMLGWSAEEMRTGLAALLSQKPDLTAYLYLGYGDGDYEYVLDAVPGFVEILEAKAPVSLRWKHHVLAGEAHVPFPSFYYGLRDLFREYAVSKEVRSAGVDGLKTHFSRLSEQFGFKMRVPSELLFDGGFNFWKEKKFAAAVPYFRLFMEEYPRDWRGYYFCGVCYQETEKTDQAVSMFRKLEDVDAPPNFAESARKKIAEITGAATPE